jgi:hypothetical protein
MRRKKQVTVPRASLGAALKRALANPTEDIEVPAKGDSRKALDLIP